jgi:hypothetical protein
MRLIGLMVVLAGSLLLALLTVGTQPLAKAQEARKTPRIGFLGATTPAGYAGQIEAMRAGFRDLGYVEGISSSNIAGRKDVTSACPTSRKSLSASRSISL